MRIAVMLLIQRPMVTNGKSLKAGKLSNSPLTISQPQIRYQTSKLHMSFFLTPFHTKSPSPPSTPTLLHHRPFKCPLCQNSPHAFRYAASCSEKLQDPSMAAEDQAQSSKIRYHSLPAQHRRVATGATCHRPGGAVSIQSAQVAAQSQEILDTQDGKGLPDQSMPTGRGDAQSRARALHRRY